MTVSGSTTFLTNGNIVNSGTLTVYAGSTLSASGAASFTNDGLLDLLTSPASTLPAGFVNNGTVILSNNVAVRSFSKTGTSVALSILSFTGHNYQLQGRASISSGSWQNIGSAQGGTSITNNDGSISGTVLNFSDTGGATGSAKFYRIQVSP